MLIKRLYGEVHALLSPRFSDHELDFTVFDGESITSRSGGKGIKQDNVSDNNR